MKKWKRKMGKTKMEKKKRGKKEEKIRGNRKR